MNQAETPFQFVAAPFLSLIDNQVAHTLAEFEDGIEHASDASIFYHTFQSIEAHHYTSFSSDFAQWALTALLLPIVTYSAKAGCPRASPRRLELAGLVLIIVSTFLVGTTLRRSHQRGRRVRWG